jgi:hypothetical protein
MTVPLLIRWSIKWQQHGLKESNYCDNFMRLKHVDLKQQPTGNVRRQQFIKFPAVFGVAWDN